MEKLFKISPYNQNYPTGFFDDIFEKIEGTEYYKWEYEFLPPKGFMVELYTLIKKPLQLTKKYSSEFAATNSFEKCINMLKNSDVEWIVINNGFTVIDGVEYQTIILKNHL